MLLYSQLQGKYQNNFNKLPKIAFEAQRALPKRFKNVTKAALSGKKQVSLPKLLRHGLFLVSLTCTANRHR